MRRLKRTLTVVAMFVMAINANAYRWQSPYAYCNNNQYTDESGPNKGWEHNIMGNSMNGTLDKNKTTYIHHSSCFLTLPNNSESRRPQEVPLPSQNCFP